MRIRPLHVSVALMAVLCSFHALCLDLEQDFKQEIALYRIRPDQARSLKRDANGIPVSESRLKQAAQNFYDWLYPLDPAFLKRFKIKTVVFKDTVYDRDGRQFQRYLFGDELFLDADLSDRQFYTNIFYLQATVMQQSYIGRWTKLNPDGFSYEEKRGSLSGNAQKKLDEILAGWDKYFVSRAAMYSPEMDMAETFTYMITKGPQATAFVRENSPDVQKKFDMVADILESVKATERGYMETLLAEDLSQLKTYSPYALSVRLFREKSGAWQVIRGQQDGTEPAEEPARIGDPVEVAGRKVNPLILSLETGNMRLFRLLMQNKADPDAVNDKKVCALMLAIANNDPEQVKLLLEAGAKVTQETARAGTASGVNAEIVKMMNAYMPGVRQSTQGRTGKAQTGKAGNSGAAKSSGKAAGEAKRTN